MELEKAPTLHEEDSKVTLTIRLIMQGKVRDKALQTFFNWYFWNSEFFLAVGVYITFF